MTAATEPGRRAARGDRGRSLAAAAFAVVVLGALAWGAHGRWLELGLVGWDAWPMVATSRVEAPGDLAEVVTQPHLGGRYTLGRFWRPVKHLSFALGDAVLGTSAAARHAVDVAIAWCGGALLVALGLRLLGRERLVAACVAGVVLVLHPLQVEVVPAVARRGETLALVLVVATLLAQGRSPASPRRGWAWASFALALLACGAKEVGVLVAPLVLALHLGRGDAPGPGARLRAAARDASPALAAVALYLVARTAVLGGLGGHGESSLGGLLGIHRTAAAYLRLVVEPQPLVADPGLAAGLAWALAGGLAAVAALAWRRAPAGHPTRSGAPLALLWLALLLVPTALSGRVQAWNAIAFVPPYALFVGLAADEGVAALRARRLALAVPALAVAGVLVASHVGFSPLLRRYPEWERVDALTRETFARLEELVARTPPGGVVVLDRIVPTLPVRPDRGVRGAHVLGVYGVQAWADLHLPERRVRIVELRGRPPRRSADGATEVHLFAGVLR